MNPSQAGRLGPITVRVAVLVAVGFVAVPNTDVGLRRVAPAALPGGAD